MNRKWSAVASVFATAFCFIGLPGCGHDQELVSIAVTPAVENFGSATTPVNEDAGLSVQLRALGTYIHPPATKDITDQVAWTSNTPGMVTVNSAGLITATGMECGGTIISATVTTNKSNGDTTSNGALVTGTMTANVICFSTTGSIVRSGPVLSAALRQPISRR